MGTKVQIENYLPGHYSTRDPSHESSGAGWPSCYGERQFCYGFVQRTVSDSHSGYDKDVVKQTMLEHEAVFKNQVCELHRLYRVQRDLMDEARRKEQFRMQIPYEGSSSSSPVPSHMRYEDAPKCNGSSLPFASHEGGRFISGQATTQSSPNSVKGKSIQSVPIQFQNGHSPKNSEVSESRPTKFRRRILDLQLPADEYIDTDEVEQFGGAKAFDLLDLSPDKTNNSVLANSKMFPYYSRNTECQGDASSSDVHLRKPNTLADLNEPLHVEEVAIDSSVEFLGPGGSHGDVTCREFSTGLVGSSKDAYQNSKKGGRNGTLQNYSETRPNGQDWFLYALQPEQYKGNVRSINHGNHLEKALVSSQALRVLPDQRPQHADSLLTNHIKMDPWKAKYVGMTEKSDRSYSSSSCVGNEPNMASHASSQPGWFHYSDLDKSWYLAATNRSNPIDDIAASNWRNPNDFLSQKPASVQTSPLKSSTNFSNSPQLSAHSNPLFGNRWNLNKIPVANAAFGSELPVRNGYYQGAPTAYKEVPTCFPPAGLDYGNCSYNEMSMPCSSNSYFKATSYVDVIHPAKEMNLNLAVPNVVLDDHVNLQSKITSNGCKSEDPQAALPWLKGKGAYSEAENLKKSLDSLDNSQCPPVRSSSYKGDTKPKKPEISQKILGVLIHDNTPLPKESSDFHVFNQTGNLDIQSSQRKGGFDINTPCELIDSELERISVDDVVDVKKMKTESGCLRNHFDLNLCITEEETPHGACLLDNSITVKVGTGIDLEAPVVIEDEDTVLPVEEMKEPDMQQPKLQSNSSCNDGEVELVQSAAVAIVDISSCANYLSMVKTTYLPPEANMDDPFNWFVDLACSRENIVEGDGSLEGLDDFESMILRMKECTVEEYFPKPSIPEFPIAESTTGVLTTRTRRGQGRRGRQRRDFQRDILPGLTTLSRHEVTEDLQTFGGLMRATGYSWQSGSNRRNATRNGSGRGRRRSTAAAAATPVVTNTVCALPLKQQQQKQQQQQVHIYNTEVSLEDRSLRGWGKTTRRPRRQRCPAGNPPPPIPLPNYMVRDFVNP